MARVRLLFSDQHEEGYWCGELVADTTLESDYILLHTLLGTGNPERFQKAANWILQHQNEDGGWGIYAEAAVEYQRLGESLLWLEAWRVIKLTIRRWRGRGRRSWRWVASLRSTPLPRSILCFFGQYDYDAVPAIPPEIVLFPQLVLVQHLRDFFVVAGDSGAAFDLPTRRSRLRRFRKRWAWRSFSSVDATSRACTCHGTRSGFPGAIFSWFFGPADPLVRARTHSSAAFDGAAARLRSGCSSASR